MTLVIHNDYINLHSRLLGFASFVLISSENHRRFRFFRQGFGKRMCLKDPSLEVEQEGKQIMQQTLPKSIRPEKAAVAHQMLPPLAECSTGKEASAVFLNDLLCGEALSPTTTTYCHHQFGELHTDTTGTTSAVRGWLVNVTSTSIHFPAQGSSFLSKSKENSCSMNIDQLNSFSHADDTATIALRNDPPLETMVVGGDSISNPSLVDLGEAMRVLQEREATTTHGLTYHYINTLICSDLDSNKSYNGLGSARREGVYLIFKVLTLTKFGWVSNISGCCSCESWLRLVGYVHIQCWNNLVGSDYCWCILLFPGSSLDRLVVDANYRCRQLC